MFIGIYRFYDCLWDFAWVWGLGFRDAGLFVVFGVFIVFFRIWIFGGGVHGVIGTQ